MQVLNKEMTIYVKGGFDLAQLGVETGIFAAAGVIPGLLVGAFMADAPAKGALVGGLLLMPFIFGAVGAAQNIIKQNDTL